MWTDADLAGDPDESKSTSGIFLGVTGGNTFVALSGSSTKQTSTAASTGEAEIVAAFQGQKSVGIPALFLWEVLLDRKGMKVQFNEDNEACLAICRTGRNPSLRHVDRTQKISVGWLHEQWGDTYEGWACSSHMMCADIFTKAFATKDRAYWWQVVKLIAHLTPKEWEEFKSPPPTPKAKWKPSSLEGGPSLADQDDPEPKHAANGEPQVAKR